MSACTGCGTALTERNAYRRSDATTYRSRCRACLAGDRRARHDQAEDERRALFGRDLCDICGQSEIVTRGGKVRRPSADHDHSSGAWRGLLCSRCNAGLGMFRDQPELLRAAAKYLENPPGLAVTPPAARDLISAVVESLEGAA